MATLFVDLGGDISITVNNLCGFGCAQGLDTIPMNKGMIVCVKWHLSMFRFKFPFPYIFSFLLDVSSQSVPSLQYPTTNISFAMPKNYVIH